MTPDGDSIKEILFEYVRDSLAIQDMLVRQDYEGIINDILEGCYEKVSRIGDSNKSVESLATGILHYLLTQALLPSQRKAEFCGILTDIIVPDVKMLRADPKKALLISIQGTADADIIRAKIAELKTIQPERQNIWLVLPAELNLKYKTYVISKNGASFSRIISDISQFVNLQGQGKLKIMRI